MRRPLVVVFAALLVMACGVLSTPATAQSSRPEESVGTEDSLRYDATASTWYMDLDEDGVLDAGEHRFATSDTYYAIDYDSDGDGSVSDTELQAAIDAMEATTRGGTLILPEQVIEIGTTITMGGGLTTTVGAIILQGQGSGIITVCGLNRAATVFSPTATLSGPLLRIQGATSGYAVRNIAFRMWPDGESDLANEVSEAIIVEADATPGQNGGRFDGISITSLEAETSTGVGIYFRSVTVTNAQVDKTEIYNSSIRGPSVCFKQDSFNMKRNVLRNTVCAYEDIGVQIIAGGFSSVDSTFVAQADADGTETALQIHDEGTGLTVWDPIEVVRNHFQIGLGDMIRSAGSAPGGPELPVYLSNNNIYMICDDSVAPCSQDIINIKTDGPVISIGNRIHYDSITAGKTANITVTDGGATTGRLFWLGNELEPSLGIDVSGSNVDIWAPFVDATGQCNDIDLDNDCEAGELFTEQAHASGADPGATCTVGQIYIDTDETDDTNCTTTADNSLCLCTATNTWTALENN